MTRNRRKMIEKTADSLLLSKHSIQFSALFLLLSDLGLKNVLIYCELRQNIEWMWANYPPSIRFSTMLFINENGGNVLDADVIRSMYRVRKDISNIKTEFGECVYLLMLKKLEIFG